MRYALTYKTPGGYIALLNLGEFAATEIKKTQLALGSTDLRMQRQGWGYSDFTVKIILPANGRTLLTQDEVERVRAYVDAH